jgi:hypothetical protein
MYKILLEQLRHFIKKKKESFEYSMLRQMTSSGILGLDFLLFFFFSLHAVNFSICNQVTILVWSTMANTFDTGYSFRCDCCCCFTSFSFLFLYLLSFVAFFAFSFFFQKEFRYYNYTIIFKTNFFFYSQLLTLAFTFIHIILEYQ